MGLGRISLRQIVWACGNPTDSCSPDWFRQTTQLCDFGSIEETPTDNRGECLVQIMFYSVFTRQINK